jgi:REP element-mobilizing transposase RayT
MPNHFHFLIRIRPEEDLTKFLIKKKNLSDEDLQGLKDLGGLKELIRKLPSQQFSNLFNGYTKAINKMYSRKGSLFQPNLKRKAVEQERYFTILIRYIHLNPVLHGFVDEAAGWKFSSLFAYESDKPSYLARKTVFDWFGGKELFQEYHNHILEEEIKRIRKITFELL